MAKKIHQFKNIALKQNILIDDSNKKNYFPVIKLGIQGAPGVKFSLNDGGNIEIGRYGIYELDLTNLGGLITSIVFPDDEVNEKYKANIIVDIVYEGRDS